MSASFLASGSSSVAAEAVGSHVAIVRWDYGQERRRKLRIDGPISAHVRGKDSNGGAINLEATLDNLSAGGLHLRIRRRVEKSTELSFEIRLPPGAGPDDPGMRIAASGIVRRIEPGVDDTWGLGVEFRRHRQIHTRSAHTLAADNGSRDPTEPRPGGSGPVAKWAAPR